MELKQRCWNCRRTAQLCLCNELVPQSAPVRIGILRHPNERRKTIGTATLARSCLADSFLLDGMLFDSDERLEKALLPWSGKQVGILFPSAESVDISEAPPELRCLLVLDGTWSEAKKILSRSPSLQKIPQYRFTPERPSNYRIRKQPKSEGVSTIEAISYSLKALGAEEQCWKALLNAFDLMVERQLAFKHRHPRQKPNALLKQQKVEEGVVNWYLKSSSPERIRLFLRGEIDLPHRPIIKRKKEESSEEKNS